jgi:hypothetical protein
MGTVVRFPTKLPPGMVSPRVPAGNRAPDGLLEMMKREGVPLTRKNYIDMATAGGTVEWSAEHEAEPPEELRQVAEDDGSFAGH